jgi:hypothetical protein
MRSVAEHADRRVTPLILVEEHPFVNCCNEFRLRRESVTVVYSCLNVDHSDSGPLLSHQIPVAPIDLRRPASCPPSGSLTLATIGHTTQRPTVPTRAVSCPVDRGASLSGSPSPRSHRCYHLAARTGPSGARWRLRSMRVAPRRNWSVPAQQCKARIRHPPMDLRGASARSPRRRYAEELEPAPRGRGLHWPHPRRRQSRSLPKQCRRVVARQVFSAPLRRPHPEMVGSTVLFA